MCVSNVKELCMKRCKSIATTIFGVTFAVVSCGNPFKLEKQLDDTKNAKSRADAERGQFLDQRNDYYKLLRNSFAIGGQVFTFFDLKKPVDKDEVAAVCSDIGFRTIADNDLDLLRDHYFAKLSQTDMEMAKLLRVSPYSIDQIATGSNVENKDFGACVKN
jgi:hypothetical protein